MGATIDRVGALAFDLFAFRVAPRGAGWWTAAGIGAGGGLRRGRRWILIVLLAAALPLARGLVGRRPAPVEDAAPAARGGARAVPPAAPHGAAAPPPARLRLATWNVAWLNRSDGQGHVRRDSEDYERLRRHAGRIDADVVAVQEVDGPEAARRLFEPSSWDLHLTDDPDNLQRTGLALRRGLDVTRHPDLVDLAISGGRRGADLTVHLQGGDLRLLAVHLKSGCPQDNLSAERQACRILRRQLPVLEGWIDARARESAAFVVLGDFNRRFEPPDRFWAEIDDADPPGADLFAVTEGRRPSCWGGRYPSFIDHIVLGGKAQAWFVTGSFRTIEYTAADAPFEPLLSDHCPLRIDIDARRKPVAPPRLTAGEAAAHVGEHATVCGRVAGARYGSSHRGPPTFLKPDRAQP